MLLTELFESSENSTVLEGAKIAWARVGNKIVKKYRCTDGKRVGRIVKHPADCYKPFNIKRRLRMKQTRLAKSHRMKLRAIRTKRRNPASIRLQRMNKGLHRK